MKLIRALLCRWGLHYPKIGDPLNGAKCMAGNDYVSHCVHCHKTIYNKGSNRP